MSVAKTIAVRKLLENDKIEKLHVGSQGEGIALANESDTDILQVDHSVLCVENLEDVIDVDKLVFHLDQSMAPAGYTYLCLTEQGDNQTACMESLGLKAFVQDGDRMLLSSTQYLSENKGMPCSSTTYFGRNTTYHPPQGPSIPRNFTDIVSKFQDWWFASMLNDDTDLVQGFPCLCPGILQAWSARPRASDWPSQELIQHVQSSQGYVVPVGRKGSKKEHLQWRICFTPAEMYLVQSFNDTQRKVLVLLRHIAKHLLKPICPSITSYVIKNIMFWMAEKTPVDQYQPHLLLDRLDDALMFLKSCISKKSLQNYMIQERDLLQGKLYRKEQKSLIREISTLVKQKSLIQEIPSCNEGYEKFAILYLMGNEEGAGLKLVSDLKFCDHIDIITGEVINLLTTKQMAKYIKQSLSCKNCVMFYVYHHCHIALPYIYRHKRRMLRCPGRKALDEVVYVLGLRPGKRFLSVEPMDMKLLLSVCIMMTQTLCKVFPCFLVLVVMNNSYFSFLKPLFCFAISIIFIMIILVCLCNKLFKFSLPAFESHK